MATKAQVTFYNKILLVHVTEVRSKASWDKTSPQNGHDRDEEKSSSIGPILHLNDLKEKLLGDGLSEDVVDVKIMHQCIKVL